MVVIKIGSSLHQIDKNGVTLLELLNLDKLGSVKLVSFYECFNDIYTDLHVIVLSDYSIMIGYVKNSNAVYHRIDKLNMSCEMPRYVTLVDEGIIYISVIYKRYTRIITINQYYNDDIQLIQDVIDHVHNNLLFISQIGIRLNPTNNTHFVMNETDGKDVIESIDLNRSWYEQRYYNGEIMHNNRVLELDGVLIARDVLSISALQTKLIYLKSDGKLFRVSQRTPSTLLADNIASYVNLIDKKSLIALTNSGDLMYIDVVTGNCEIIRSGMISPILSSLSIKL
jgi:hypothetical protein